MINRICLDLTMVVSLFVFTDISRAVLGEIGRITLLIALVTVFIYSAKELPTALRFHRKLLFDRTTFFIMLPAIGLMGGVINDGRVAPVVIHDLAKLLVYLFSFVLLLFVALQSKENLKRMSELLLKLFFIFASVVAIISLFKFALLLSGAIPGHYLRETLSSYGTSISRDYNSFALAMLLGLISLFACLRLRLLQLQNRLFYLLSFLITLSISISFSRRGLLTLFVLWGVFLILIYSRRLSHSPQIKAALRNTVLASILASFFTNLIFMSFLFGIGPSSRNLITGSIGLPHHEVLHQVNSWFYRQCSLIPFSQEYCQKIGMENLDPIQGQLRAEDHLYSEVGRGKSTDHLLSFLESNDGLTSSRILLWKESYRIFSEYSWPQKLLGNGFGYGEALLNVSPESSVVVNKKTFDYPHNYLVSATLYSGLLGLFAVLVFLYFQVRGAIALNRMGFIEIAFAMTAAFMFAIFSGNSFVSMPYHYQLSLFAIVAYSVSRDSEISAKE